MSGMGTLAITRGRTLVGRLFLTQRCTIKRTDVTGTDEYGAPVYGQPYNLATSVPCYLYSETGFEERTPEREALSRQWYLLVGRTQDVTNSDSISSITDQMGTLLVSGPVAITDVTPAETHLRLALTGLAP